MFTLRLSHSLSDRSRSLGISLAVMFCVSSLDGVINIATADEQADRQLAVHLIEQAGVQRGVCSVLGNDDSLAVELTKASELLVHVRDKNAGQVDALRAAAEEAGFGIDRLVVDQGGFKRLPYADNMIDCLIVTNADEALLSELPISEVLRVLRPEGKAIIGKALRSQGADVDLQKLKAWASSGGGRVKTSTDKFGMWLECVKPTPGGLDEWTHWEKAPDNNPVSKDTIIKAPYMTQYMAGPLYIGMPSITTSAGGKNFLAIGHISHHRREWNMLNKLIVRNAYNGVILWERPLPEGYLVHRSAFIATRDAFHMIDRDRCLLLDPDTGDETGEIRIPGLKGHWKWMVRQDDVLYVMAGKPDPKAVTMKGDRTYGGWSWADMSKGYYGKQIPFGFGDMLAAYDLKAKKTLWTHKEESVIDSRGMALRDGNVYLYCPAKHLRALDAKTGDVAWTNGDSKVFNLIEEPGKGLVSTPGFRTSCIVVATPDALIIQGQTRNNVVAVSTKDGYLLWTKRKFTNNPNAIFLGGNVILGVGKRGSHVSIDPISGEVKEDFKFFKTACTRLTATGDSLFCRGEGTLRFDLKTKKLLIDSAQRPACNDGAMPANGLLYMGPWQCDCNLSLIGNIAKCSAGDFKFDFIATEEERLEKFSVDLASSALATTDKDWPTYRGNNSRSSSSLATVPNSVRRGQDYTPNRAFLPTAPTAVGNLLFFAGDDGKVRAINSGDNSPAWEYQTAGPIKFPPTIASGKAYVGSGDGYVYCLEGATGQLLWRFRAAPVERKIMLYGSLSSTWPVHSGVLVDDGVAYFAAGVIDQDGTYVYALDAENGKIVWQNNSSGHLNPELRKGVSVQGNLTIRGNQLILAGGNQVSPAAFDIKTGEVQVRPITTGRPQANNGRFVGALSDNAVIAGGRILHSDPRNVSNKNSFLAISGKGAYRMSFGGIPPAWNDDVLALVNFKHGKLTCCEYDKTAARIEQGQPQPKKPSDRRAQRWLSLSEALAQDGGIRWDTDLGQPNKFEAVALAVCPNAIVGVVSYQQRTRAQTEWFVAAFDTKTGRPLWRQPLSGDPLPGGLLVDRNGKISVVLLDGRVASYQAAN